MSTHETPPPAPPETNARASAAADKAYRKASRPWFKKKRFLIPLILLVIFIIASASNSGNKDSAAVVAPAASGAAPAPSTDASGAAPAAAAAPPFPGSTKDDVVGQGGAALKVGDATVTSTPLVKGDAMFGPTLCTTVTMVNGSKDTISFHSWDWKLQTPAGTIAMSTVAGSKNILPGGELVPGGKATGDVCFDNKNKEAGQFIVLYEPAFAFFSDRAAWINTL